MPGLKPSDGFVIIMVLNTIADGMGRVSLNLHLFLQPLFPSLGCLAA